MEVSWTDAALAERDEILAFVERQSVANTELVRARLDAAVRLIAGMPGIGRHGSMRGTREFLVPRTGFLLVYELVRGQRDSITFVSVRRGSRR